MDENVIVGADFSSYKYVKLLRGTAAKWIVPRLRRTIIKKGNFRINKGMRKIAFFQCQFHSEALGVGASMNVILPQKPVSQILKDGNTNEHKYPTLYLLHGLSDDHTIWMRRTSIERYVSTLGLAVVMPAVNRSFYTDMVSGAAYWTFISEELPALARSFFPLSDKREDNFVAGLSMGGYGAFKLALRYPERFAAAASMSGAVDIVNRFDAFKHDCTLIFGSKEDLQGSTNDLFYLVEQAVTTTGTSSLPPLFQCCGTEDYLYGDNIKFRDFARSFSLPLTYEEGPGNHSWDYWDAAIQRVLQWLPINKS